MRKFPLLLLLVLGAPIVAALPGGSMIQAILGIGFLIFIHEWGHYIACVLTGTKTEAFSVGFGPRLFGWERDPEGKRRFTVGARQLDPEDGSMDFRIAAVPLGGYVKMAGGEIIGNSSSTDPGHFVNKSASARIFIVCAGVIMNFVTAFAFYTLVYANGKPHIPPVVGLVTPGGPAWTAGMQPGDRIVEMDGDRMRTFYDVRIASVFGDSDVSMPVKLDRGGKEVSVSLRPSYLEDLGMQAILLEPSYELVLGQGDREIRIGRQTEAVIGGERILGGHAAARALERLLVTRQGPIEIQVEGQPAFEVQLAGGTAPEGVPPPRRIGLEALTELRIKALRAGINGFDVGDQLLAAEVKDQRVPLGNAGDLQRALSQDIVTALFVKRGEEEVRVPLELPGGTTVTNWDAHVAVEAKPGRTVRPSSVGMLSRGPQGSFWRYTSSAAADAGVREGDELLSADGLELETFSNLIDVILKAKAGDAIALRVRGVDGGERDINVTPQELAYAGSLDVSRVERIPLETEGLADSLSLAGGTLAREVRNVFRTIGALFTGRLSFNKNIAGPLRLVDASKRLAERSWLDLFWFLAYVSVMLAVLNILPIPVLDGGHLLFIIIEKIKGSPLKESVVVASMYVGLFLLLTLMFFAFKNDFVYFLG
jgi:regulator of sigma E protease